MNYLLVLARTLVSLCLGGIALLGYGQPRPGRVGGPCECCEGFYEQMPTRLSESTSVAGAGEPGEPLHMSGIIYKPDGRTPAPGIILYVYHTNAAGYYADWAGNAPRVTDQTPCAVRHGHLRSWMKTDQQGRYAFQTIRPGPYPGRQTAAHIHAIVKEPDLNEYYIADYLFSDDPLLTQPQRRQAQALGGSGLVTLSRGRNGYWEGKRDIVLGANVPDYPAH